MSLGKTKSVDSSNLDIGFDSLGLQERPANETKISPFPSPHISPTHSPLRAPDRADHDSNNTPGSTTSGSGSDFTGDELHLSGNDSIICVAFHLPVRLQCIRDKKDESKIVDWEVTWDKDALLSRKKATQADYMRILFVGTLRTAIPVDQEDLVAKKLERFNCASILAASILRASL